MKRRSMLRITPQEFIGGSIWDYVNEQSYELTGVYEIACPNVECDAQRGHICHQRAPRLRQRDGKFPSAPRRLNSMLWRYIWYGIQPCFERLQAANPWRFTTRREYRAWLVVKSLIGKKRESA